MGRSEIAAKSAWKAAVSTFFLALSAAVLGGAADFFLDSEILSTLLTGNWVLLVPVFNFVGQWLKDYIKHNGGL